MLNVGSFLSRGDELVRSNAYVKQAGPSYDRTSNPTACSSIAWKLYYNLMLARNNIHACQNSCVTHVARAIRHPLEHTSADQCLVFYSWIKSTSEKSGGVPL